MEQSIRFLIQGAPICVLVWCIICGTRYHLETKKPGQDRKKPGFGCQKGVSGQDRGRDMEFWGSLRLEILLLEFRIIGNDR